MPNHLLHHQLTNTSWRCPEKEAVIAVDRSISYQELEERSNQLASVLRRAGVQKGDRVGIFLSKSIESLISLFAILKNGSTYVPIDPRLPSGRIEYILQNCGIACMISSSATLKKVLADLSDDLALKKVILTDWDGDENEKPEGHPQFIPWTSIRDEDGQRNPGPDIADVNPAYILYTSGSTGAPKGVAISHLNSLTFVNMAAEYFGIDTPDRLASFAPLHFDLSIFDIFTAVRQGASIVLVPEFYSTFPIRLAEYIDKQRITVWNSVSSVLIMLVDMGKLEKCGFETLRLIHFSGDILPPKYLRELKSHMKNADFYNIYGQTEANSSMCYHIGAVPPGDHWKIPIGKPFPNFEVFAVNEDGRKISSPGQEGELYVKSSTVAVGYWNDGDRTKERFTSNPLDPADASRCYKTGDIVKLDDEGNFVFVGRKDSMVKSRGYRIELNEIEIILNGHPLVRQAVAVAAPDEKIGHRVVGFASLVEGESLPEIDLLRYCQDRLPKYMVPESIHFLKRLPTTSSGKVDRKAMEKEALEG